MRNDTRPLSRSPSPPPISSPGRSSLMGSPAMSPRGSLGTGNLVLEQSRQLLQGLRMQAQKTSSPQNKKAFQQIANEVEDKLNMLESQLERSQQNSPVVSPRGRGSMVRYDLRSASPPPGKLQQGVNRSLDFSFGQPNSNCVAWSFAMMLSVVNEAAPYALVCALTGMLARSGPPGMPLAVRELAVFSAALAATQFGCGLLYTVAVSVSVSHLQSAIDERAWGCVGKRIWSSVITALVCGAISGGTMIAFEKQTYDLLDFSGPARIACSPYFRARCAALAPNMVLRVVLSTYDAFGRRFAGCALNVVASVCEALLAFHFVFALGWTLQGVGIASIAASTAVATVGLLAVPFFQPASARGRVRFYASTPVISQLVAFCSRASGMRSMRMNLLDESGEYAPPVSVYPSLMQGLDTMIRFLCLQGPIMAGTIYASRIGEGALVANHIALLVWMFTSPVIDGASIVCAPLAHDNISMRHFDSQRRLSYQLAAVGIIFGGICTAGFWFAKHAVLAVLLGGDPVDLSVLSNLTMVWLLISGMQVVNSIGSTYDGLLLASSQFSYVRNQLLFGGIAVFLPALIVGHQKLGNMYGIWGALAVFSMWRCLASVGMVHWRLYKDSSFASGRGASFGSSRPVSPRAMFD